MMARISGADRAAPVRLVSAGIRRRAQMQGMDNPQPDGNISGVQDPIDPNPDQDARDSDPRESGGQPKKTNPSIAATETISEDGKPFADFISILTPFGDRSVAQDGDDTMHSKPPQTRPGVFSEALPGHPQEIPVHANDVRPTALSEGGVKRSGVEKWLPNIGSFLITVIVILAVIWITVIELSSILGG
ncbi:hypothetical protein [Thalassospira sp. MCCC 1A03138]|uniref:hypothetical protein n=1 Tax=Thalassospira sp. MCCC 1A03138 TaxID=1470576 RepID=UPI000A1F78D2|nr:hypothetical protein [Thalassospira sp. MCCC 1A03138]OSQ29965.1 hypothetical protein TH468_14435 [Thalassospira sp. MCCC 1A03138]